MSTNLSHKSVTNDVNNGSIPNPDDYSMNMTGALITMMGKFLSTLNQSSMIQNAMICTERSTSLDMIANQSAMQVADGTANATAQMVSGIGSIVGGVAAVGGGIAGVLSSAGQLAELSNVGKDSSIILDEVDDGTEVEMQEVSTSRSVNPGPESDAENTASSVTSPSSEEDEIDDDIATQGQKSEMDKRLEQDTIKAKWDRFSNLHHIGQGFSGLTTGLGQALASTFTTQAAAAQAAATKLGGLAQSVNSMMSSTESNYQSTMSLNTQLANEFQQFTAWWLASSKA